MISFRTEYGNMDSPDFHSEEIMVDLEGSDFMTEVMAFREAMAVAGHSESAEWEIDEKDWEEANDSTEDSD